MPLGGCVPHTPSAIFRSCLCEWKARGSLHSLSLEKEPFRRCGPLWQLLFAIEPSQLFELDHNLLKLKLAFLQVNVLTNSWIFARKVHHVLVRHIKTEARVNFAWKLIEKFGQQLDVDEHDRHVS